MGDNKKVHHIDLMLQEQLLAVISGRNRHVRLFPTQALDGRETESYKLAETKGCQTIVSGLVRNSSLTCLCVAMKRQIICYEVRPTAAPPTPADCLVFRLFIPDNIPFPDEQEQNAPPPAAGAAGAGSRPVDGAPQRAALRGLSVRLHPLQVSHDCRMHG